MNTSSIPGIPACSKEFITIKNQIYILYSQAAVTFIFPVIAAICLTLVLWDIAIKSIISIWLAVVFVHSAIRFVLVWRFHQSNVDQDNARIWLNRFITSVFTSGTIWGIAGIILVPHANSIEFTLYNGLTLLIICGLVSGALISYSVNIWVLLIYSFPALIPPAIYLISLGDKYNSAFGGFILLYYFFISVAAARMNKLFGRYLEMDQQQQELSYKYENLKSVYSEFRKRFRQ